MLGIMTFKYMDAEGLAFAVPGDVVLRQLPALWASDQLPPSVPPLVAITKPDLDDNELTRRIEEAIQELMPTPTPTPTPSPAPRPTHAIVPTPRSAATPTLLPPMPAPTLSPCAMAEIPPLDELDLEYQWFMLGDPYTNSVNAEFRETLAKLFPAITAAYILEFVDNPTKYASFRDYLSKVGYQGANGDIKAKFRSLRHSGILPGVDESLYEYNQQSDPCALTRTIVFVDDELMTLLAVVYAESGVNPWMRDAVTRITAQDIHKFRDRDPSTPLVYFILEMDDSAN